MDAQPAVAREMGEVGDTVADRTAPPASGAAQPTSRSGSNRPEPTIVTLQDLLDLPRQILPAETYRHLQNATRETVLTFYSLWRHINKTMSGNSGRRTRKRIDVE